MLTHPIVQIAYFVPDAAAAAEAMARKVGAGPFFFIRNIELDWGELRGQPCQFVHSSAYGQWSELMVEFVQQEDRGPSPFREVYPEGKQGIHHVATMVDSMEETYRHYASLGVQIAARAATRTGTEFAFIDTVDQLGHMIEVYERTPELVAFYDKVRSASLNWDGTEPVRRSVDI